MTPKRAILLMLLLCLSAGCGAHGVKRTDGESARLLEIGSSREPDIQWDRSSLLTADLDCDGVPDSALLGRAGKGAAVLIVLGPAAAGSRAGVVKLAPAELCGDPLALKLEDLEDSPKKGCKGLSLSSGECDAFHIFWNREDGEIDWWRL
jgi:hypothetical protein